MSTTDLNMMRISQRFTDDMELSGLVPGTQKTYINAVLTCVQH